MSRPSLKAKFIASAIARFQKNGFKSCTIEDIATDAGAFKGSFYNHFKSKEAIAVATVELYFGAGISTLAMKGPPSPIKRIHSHFAQLNTYAKKNTPGQGCLLATFTSELSDDSRELRQAVNKAMNNWYEAIATVIRQAQDAGEVAKHHKADELARCLVNAWEGASLRVRATKSFAPIDEFFKITFKTLLK